MSPLEALIKDLMIKDVLNPFPSAVWNNVSQEIAILFCDVRKPALNVICRCQNAQQLPPNETKDELAQEGKNLKAFHKTEMETKRRRGCTPRIYLKVHDPATCTCLARNYFAKVQQPREGREQNRMVAKDIDQAMARSGATVFDSIFFARPDGTLRNAFGDSIKCDQTNMGKHAEERMPVGANYHKLGDLIEIVELDSSSEWCSLGLVNNISSMLDWPMEFLS